MTFFRSHTTFARLVLAALVFAFALTLAPASPALAEPAGPLGVAADAAPAARYSLFVPVSANGKKGGPAPQPQPVAGGLFLTRDPQTSGADIAVDAQGGMHVSYAAYVGYGSPSPGYYFYCGTPATCDDPKSWVGVAFGSTKEDYIVKVEIALTTAGQPRLLLYNDYNGRILVYAACDQACTNPANWSVTDLTRVQFDTDTDTFHYSYHAFEVDAQGRPRFLYQDHYGSIHNGIFYAYCDADCTDNNNWYETNISAGPDYDGDVMQTPDLKFTRDGRPRVLVQLYSNEPSLKAGLYYLTCEASCEDKDNWERTRLFDRGNGNASWTLALDGQDRPRVAFYQGEMPGGAGFRLNYAWCNSGCTSAASWGIRLVGLPQYEGEDPAIALDAQGRPRIAYTKPALAGIGYLWCNSQCETGAAQWQTRLIEPMSDPNAEYPLPPPFDCSLATWSGARPQLALDAAGNPRVAYDAERIYGGSCSAKVGWRSARVAFLPQP